MCCGEVVATAVAAAAAAMVVVVVALAAAAQLWQWGKPWRRMVVYGPSGSSSRSGSGCDPCRGRSPD